MSSVSPERCDTTAVQPARRASAIASIVSVSVPIWLSLIRTLFAAPSVDRPLDPLGVRHEQVVADELDAVAEPARQLGPAGPVVLGQAVLDRDDRVAVDPVGPEVDQLAGVERPVLRREPVARRCAVPRRCPPRPARSSPDRARSRRPRRAGSRPSRSPGGSPRPRPRSSRATARSRPRRPGRSRGPRRGGSSGARRRSRRRPGAPRRTSPRRPA